ncbi:MAG: hypothetical protein K9K86_03405 [Pseudomonadales bacterium]|nr:hypothetical protein [Pseudomonadales bacterium]
MANLVGLLTLCGHILELVEAQIFLLGVLLSTLSGVILRNYFITKSIITHRATSGYEQKKNKLGWCNYYFICAIKTHYLMASSIITIEVVISRIVVIFLYPALRLFILLPKINKVESMAR